MAHVYVPEDCSQLQPDRDGEYAIYVGFAYDFSSGVSDKYLEIGFSRWIETINELVHTDSVRTLAVR
jgi:hypothetical protein